MTVFSRFFCTLVSLGLLVVAGCTSDTVWRGEVASINGRPITLTQVAALRNSTYFDWTSSPMAELDVMRKQYGDALTNLLAVELVKQHLEKKKLAVTAEDVAEEESRIRADYPAGTFEDVLLSEAIDLETWRFLLHNYLSVQRFLDKVIRMDVVLAPEEAEAYKQAHPDEFKRPPWVYFFLISGVSAEQVAECSKDLDDTGDPVRVQERHPEAVIRTVRMDTPRLDPALAVEVAKLRPGDLSPVLEVSDEFHQILLLESLPARDADPQEAYMQIEEILIAQKMNAAYNDWIIGRLRKATVKVSSQLLPHLRKTGVVSDTSGAKDADSPTS